MPDKPLTVAQFEALQLAAANEGRRLTHKERLQNPTLQKELARQKAAAIEAAQKAVDKAKVALEAAEDGLKAAKKENA